MPLHHMYVAAETAQLGNGWFFQRFEFIETQLKTQQVLAIGLL